MLWLLVISCVAIVIYGSRDHWLCKQCPSCRLMCMGQARKCSHCLEWFPLLAIILGALAWTSPALAQGINLVPCPSINFFGDACETDEPPPQAAHLPQPHLPVPPLFSKDTMAPDTPPLMLSLLNSPTPEAAKQFVAWQQRRMRAMALAQQLIQQETLKAQP